MEHEADNDERRTSAGDHRSQSDTYIRPDHRLIDYLADSWLDHTFTAAPVDLTVIQRHSAEYFRGTMLWVFLADRAVDSRFLIRGNVLFTHGYA